MRNLILSIFFLLITIHAKANFDFNANCVSAYKNIIHLNFAQARTQIDQEKKQHPENAITTFLDNSYDYYSLIFSNRKQDYDSWKSRKDPRIGLIDDNGPGSPYYLYTKAHIYLQWALLHGQFGDYTSAGFAINKAYGLLQSNQKKYPAFLPDNIDLGMINVLLGSLPDGTLKSSLKFFGIKGDVKTGVSILERLAVDLPKSGYRFFYDELIFYLSNVQCDYEKDSQAFVKAGRYAQLLADSPLKNYILGYSAIRTGHSKEALKWFSDEHINQRYPVFFYYQGVARLNMLDAGAPNSFQSFLKYTRGNFFVKDSYLHLGWAAILSGNPGAARSYFSNAGTKGNTYHDKDKQAQSEIKNGLPDQTLLKARLLFDGGNYARGISILKEASAEKFSGAEKLEYYYRLGRLHDEAGNDAEALSAYSQAIALGKNTRYYFAANSALFSGYIYAKRGDKNRAKSYFNMAIGMKSHEYESGIEQKAKQGLNAL